MIYYAILTCKSRVKNYRGNLPPYCF